MELSGKIAVVTGAGQGMGRGFALALAGEGADVAVLDVSAERAAGTVAELERIGRRALAVSCDVSNGEAVSAAFARVLDTFGTVDILVNNAGIVYTTMVEDMSEAEWRRVIDVNLTGVFLCCRAVIPTMQARRSGKIVNIASLAGKRMGFFSGAHYAASKAGVLGFTRQLAFELAPFKINVNALCPAGTLTPTFESHAGELREERLRQIPLGRFTTPEDQAQALLFLVSEQASMITGTSLDVDGGFSLGWIDVETYRRSRKAAHGLGP